MEKIFTISTTKFEIYGVFNGACSIFTKISSGEIFHIILDVPPMMVIEISNFG